MWTVCNIELTWTVPEHRDLVQHSNQNEPSDSKTNKLTPRSLEQVEYINKRRTNLSENVDT